jgi:hypothetical protein
MDITLELTKNVKKCKKMSKKLHGFVVHYNHSSIFPFERMYLNVFMLKSNILFERSFISFWFQYNEKHSSYLKVEKCCSYRLTSKNSFSFRINENKLSLNNNEAWTLLLI